MKIFDAAHFDAIRGNGRLWLTHEKYAAQMVPVAKLSVPGTACSWLVAAVHPHDPDRILGLCDVGDGDPQIRWTSLRSIRQRFVASGDEINCVDFQTASTLGAFAELARRNGAASALKH